MSKKKFKKIPISDFISDKKLKKIMGIIEKGDDVETAYDRIEILLSDMDLKVIGLGTNRIIFESTKKKYDEIVFKIAGDHHGIEANYREFYNGDLDDALTFSYSISDNGVFLVQEKVKVFNSKRMDKKKKEVREMLKHLSKKILLVDCKLQNFRNFGERDNGDIVLLDHGDTVPLIKYQNDNDIVNIGEESAVSLRCKRLVNITSKAKPCNGHLEYSKNFDSLICSKCGHIQSVNDAYRDIWNNDNSGYNANKELRNSLDFDADDWMKKVKNYAANIMGGINKNNDKGDDQEMKTKVINGKECKQLKGFWIPIEYFESPILAGVITSVKMGSMTPKDFLESRNLNPDEYKVKIEDHTNKPESDWVETAKVAAKMIIDTYKQSNEPMVKVYYKTIERALAVNKYVYNIDNQSKERGIWKNLMNSGLFSKVIYTKDCFILYGAVNDEDEESVQTGQFSISNEVEEAPEYKITKITNERDDIPGTKDVNGHECTAYGKYWVPNTLIEKYNVNESYEVPFNQLSNNEIKKLLKMNGYSPKFYRIENPAIINLTTDKIGNVENETSTVKETETAVMQNGVLDTIIDEADVNENDDPSNYEYDIVIDEFKSIFDKLLKGDITDIETEKLGSNRYYIVREGFKTITDVFKDFNDVYDGLFSRILATDSLKHDISNHIDVDYDISKCVNFMTKYLGFKDLYKIDEIQINFATEQVEFCKLVTDIDDTADTTNNAKNAYYEDSNVNPEFSKFLDQFDYTAIVGISKDGDTATILANSDTEKTISNIIEYYDDDCIKKIGNDTLILVQNGAISIHDQSTYSCEYIITWHDCANDCDECEYYDCKNIPNDNDDTETEDDLSDIFDEKYDSEIINDVDEDSQDENIDMPFNDNEDTSVFDNNDNADKSETEFIKECNEHVDHTNLEKAMAQLIQNNSILTDKIALLTDKCDRIINDISDISGTVTDNEQSEEITDDSEKLVFPIEEVASMKMVAIDLNELDDTKFVIDVNGSLVVFDLKKLISDYSKNKDELDPSKLHSITKIDIN